MAKLINYEHGDSIATGFVRPKVTALFFDKIWTPASIVSISSSLYVPEEVLVQETTELKIPRSSSRQAKEYVRAGDLYRHEILPNTRMYPSKLYETAMLHNVGISLSDPKVFAFSKLLELEESSFRYSKNRNEAIMVSAEEFCRQHGVHISPIYHNLTEFEKDTETIDYTRLSKGRSIKLRLRRANTFLNKDAFAICIQDFPSIIEEELSWEQVLDTRSDKISIQHLKQFTKWCNKTLSDKSPEEIRNTLYSELESYKMALKKHGIVTATGSFTTIISTASAFASIISGLNHPLLPLLSIAAVPINFGANTFFSNLANRNNPIAYLYDVEAEIAQ